MCTRVPLTKGAHSSPTPVPLWCRRRQESSRSRQTWGPGFPADVSLPCTSSSRTCDLRRLRRLPACKAAAAKQAGRQAVLAEGCLRQLHLEAVLEAGSRHLASCVSQEVRQKKCTAAQEEVRTRSPRRPGPHRRCFLRYSVPLTTRSGSNRWRSSFPDSGSCACMKISSVTLASRTHS